MYVELIQKTADIDGKKIAYVDVSLAIGAYNYAIRFDKKTKKRFNAFCRKEGFEIGRVDTPPPDKKIILKGEN